MTQACDLEYEKVENVILCPHASLADYKIAWEADERARNQNPTAASWQKHCNAIKAGYLWNQAMLNQGRDGDIETAHRIVEFGEIYTIPQTFLSALLMQRGARRLRLKPPYREHLSQAFARFFMRVGLPTPIDAVW